MSTYEFSKFVATSENLREQINKNGVAIIPNILTTEECEQMVDKMWSFFEHITQNWETPLNRNNQETWREFYKLYPLHSMLIQHWGVGHSQVAWDLRQHPKILEVFSSFWGCNPQDLLVSFDGLSLNLPPEITNRGWNRNNTWYHTDQSYTKPDFSCLQSWITGLDVNEGDATLSIMEGSNKYHLEFQQRFNITDKDNWYKLNEEQTQFYLEKGCTFKHIKCPKGSLVLWDSRTIHCGIEAFKNRAVPNIRAIVYLCYMPRQLCDKNNIKKKQKAFNELRTTSHWPCKIKLFPKNPRTYGRELQEITQINPPILTDIGRRLAGF